MKKFFNTHKVNKKYSTLIITLSLIACTASVSHADQILKAKLGEFLFFDTNLSIRAGQSCATCHKPEGAFSDLKNPESVSKGVLPGRAGNRNAPVVSYLALSPEFYFNAEEGMYVGGHFWDGRASSLTEQAKGPLLNPLEMANPDKQSVIKKIRQSAYANLFDKVYGSGALNDVEGAFDIMADAIAAFERTEQFSPFTSKYDYYLRGQTTLNQQEMRGLKLFESEDKANCAACHISQPADDGTPPMFTDFTYDNLGVPRNPHNPFYNQPEKFNPDGINYIDKGLAENPQVIKDNRVAESLGKMKVPTLRNIAITAPYMHNGYFKSLRSIVDFYNSRDVKSACENKFTTEENAQAYNCWPVAEIKENVNSDELGDLKLSTDEVDDIVAFMKTLTDGYIPETQLVINR